MPESRTLGKRVGLHSAVFRKLVLQPLGLCLTLRAKWLWSAKGRLRLLPFATTSLDALNVREGEL